MDTWIIPATGIIYLEIEDFKIDVVMTLGTTTKGFIHPIFHYTSVVFGETYFYFENEFTEFLFWQALQFTIVMIENSIFFVGSIVFTDMLEGLIDEYSHGYQKKFWMKSPIVSNDIVDALFNFDYRQVRSPYVGNGYIDFFFMGELEYALGNKQGEFCKWDP